MPSKISWCKETWNFIGGCTPIAEGCRNCCAARQAQWLVNMGNKKYAGLVKKGKWTGEVRLFPELLDQPLHWREPRAIFPAFMSDLFHEDVPFEFIGQVFAFMMGARQHKYIILTKRIKRAAEFFEWFKQKTKLTSGAWKHLYLGVSISTQQDADELIPILLQIPAAHHIVSVEPMLERIDASKYLPPSQAKQITSMIGREGFTGKSKLNSFIPNRSISACLIGCESGPKRRPCKLEWVKDLVEQCTSAGVSVHVKQLPMPYCRKEYRGKWIGGAPSIEMIDELSKGRTYVSHDPAEWPEKVRQRDLIWQR